jgi:hypothetical protein
MIQEMPFPAMQAILDDGFPDGAHNYWKASFVPALSDAVVDLIVEHAGRMRSPMSGIVVEYYGGAPGRCDRHGAAVAWSWLDTGACATAARRGIRQAGKNLPQTGRRELHCEPRAVELRGGASHRLLRRAR